jgi:hypothetical protein
VQVHRNVVHKSSSVILFLNAPQRNGRSVVLLDDVSTGSST